MNKIKECWKNIKGWYNKKKRIWNVIWIILLSAFFIGIVPGLINLAFKENSGIKFFQSEWDAADALAYYGSILSSAVTVFGVLLTLRHERKKGEEDDSIKYKPILTLTEVSDERLDINCIARNVLIAYPVDLNVNDRNYEFLLRRYVHNQCGIQPKFRLYFQNIGRGETYNASFDSFEITEMNWVDISSLQIKPIEWNYIGEIVSGGYFAVYVFLPNYLLLPIDFNDKKGLKLSTELKITYKDMFNRKKYQYVVQSTYKVVVERIEEMAPINDNENYRFMRVSYVPELTIPIKNYFSEHTQSFIDEIDYIPE